jgi:hypothetical protein
MGQESLTRFDQPKKEKTNKKTKVSRKTDLAKIKLSQTTKPANTTPSGASEETCNNKKTNNYY